MAIERFRDDHYFLSSMYPLWEPVEFPDGRGANTVEHVYQASKFSDDEEAQSQVLGAEDGVEAKYLAERLTKEGHFVRLDWDYAKVDIMRDLVLQKFTRNNKLGIWLLETGDEEIIEGNSWNDTFWGVSPQGSGNGLNWLGRILMETRETLREQEGGKGVKHATSLKA